MIRRLGRRSGAAVVLLTALLAVVPASPAGAAPVIAVDQPGDGETLATASVAVRGTVAESTPLYSINEVTLAVGSNSSKKECDATPCPFSWQVTLPLNGPYTLKVTATDGTVILGGTTAKQDRAFKVAAPPARPALDPPHVDDARNVELSWTRNTEPDMLYYAVFRKDPGASTFRQVGGKITQPPPGSKVTYVDNTTSAFTGGDYSYRVVAVRKGASGTADTEATSDPSTAGAATVPAVATTSTSTPAGTPAPVPPGGTTPTTAKPGPPAGVDLSGFLSSRSQTTPVAPITIPDPPDTGFAGTLPFGARPPGDDVEEGDAEAVPPRDVQQRGPIVEQLRGARPLVPVAGGLVLLLLALHMRLLNRRIKISEDIHVAETPPAPQRNVSARPVPAPAPAPDLVVAAVPREPVLYDVAEDEGWDSDWAPDADFPFDGEMEAEPEPQFQARLDPTPDEPEPEAEPEPEEPVAEAEPELEAEPEPEEPEPDPEPEPEPEVDVVELWAPPDDLDAPDEPGEPDEPPVEEVEVFEVVSPTRRRLARAGSR